MTTNQKEVVQYSTAVVSILSGIALAILSFFLNEHDIESGTLMFIAQAFVYAGGIFGVTMYFHTKLGEFETQLKDKIKNLTNDDNKGTDTKDNA